LGNLSTKTVLCISDDPVRLNLRCAALKEHGCHVLTAASGHDGILRCGRQRVDAVVLEADGDGSESALTVGELKRLHPQIPVIMLLARGDSLARQATAQADAVVLQSENPAKLLAVLDRSLGIS
jgi:DNA-binding response OmpR family regulator